jgi:hypothetical protein
MKRISLVCALLLLCPLALMAADNPIPPTQPAVFSTTTSDPPLCSLEAPKKAPLTPTPIFKSYILPPCIGTTSCPDGSTINCPNVSYDGYCWASDGCWVNCNEDGFIYCPGQQRAPGCEIW